MSGIHEAFVLLGLLTAGGRRCVEPRRGLETGGPDVNPGPLRRWLTTEARRAPEPMRSAVSLPPAVVAVDRRCRDLYRRPANYARLSDFRNLVAAGPKALNGAYVRFCSDLRPIRYPPKSDIKPHRSPLPIGHSTREGPRGRSSRVNG